MKRSRLSTMDILARDYPDQVKWARKELDARQLPQIEIFRQFCEQIGGSAPAVSFSSFNRWCMKVFSADGVYGKTDDAALKLLRTVAQGDVDVETLQLVSLAIRARLRFLGGDA